jgi:hypothetical protein
MLPLLLLLSVLSCEARLPSINEATMAELVRLEFGDLLAKNGERECWKIVMQRRNEVMLVWATRTLDLNVRIDDRPTYPEEVTPLQLAALHWTGALWPLLEAGADPFVATAVGKTTLLHLVCERNDVDAFAIVSEALGHESLTVLLGVKDAHGHTPLDEFGHGRDVARETNKQYEKYGGVQTSSRPQHQKRKQP